MATMSKFIRDILKANDVDPREACWDCHGTWVIFHKALERIAEKNGIAFDPPQVIESSAEKKIAVLCVTGRIGDGVPVWSIGEATPYNSKHSYPYAIAEKRAKDRVILKLAGLSGHLYSEEEADDFKESAPRPPAPAAKAPKAAAPQPVVPVVPVAPAPAAPEPVAPMAPAVVPPPPKGGADHQRSLVMGLFEKGDEQLKRQFVMDETGMNRGQASRSLKSLVDDGTLVMRGRLKGAYYITAARAQTTEAEEQTVAPAPAAPAKQERGLHGEELTSANNRFRKSIGSPPPPAPSPPDPSPPDPNGEGHRGWNEQEFDELIREIMTTTGASMLSIVQFIKEATGCESGLDALQTGAITSETAEQIRRLASSHVNQIASR